MAKGKTEQGTGGSSAAHEAWVAALADGRMAELASPAIIERGRQIVGSGTIQKPELQFPSADQVAMQATIVGTEPYRVELHVSGDGSAALRAGCTCPHAADGFFCKHQVALALFLRAALSGEPVTVDAEATRKHAATLKRAETTAAKAAGLRAFLEAQPAGVLAERLMHFASLVPELKRALQTWHATAEAAGDVKSVSKLITQLLPLHDFLDWRGTNAYARSAAQVLPVLQGALQTQAPAEALKLVERAYLRLQKQLHDSDDSGGQLGGVCSEVGQLWLQALRQAGPQPAAFGERYGELRDAEVCDFIPHAEALAAMGDAASRRYGERLRAAFEAALAAASARPAARHNTFGGTDMTLWRARHAFLGHLLATGDTEERLRVLRAGLFDERDHLSLIDELERLARAREALDCAERAHRLFPASLVIEDTLLAIYRRDGWDAEALALCRARFDRKPGARAALAVLDAARHARQAEEPLREGMWQALVAAEDATLARAKPGFAFRGQSGPRARDVSERLAWLMGEGRLDEAVALAQPPHAAGIAVLESLALALPREHHAQAAALLQRVFGGCMPGATSPYGNELRLVRLIIERLPAADAAVWLAGLRAEYRAKRNFIAGLP